MKSYTITVNGTAYEVTVEENGNAAAPVAAAPKAAAPKAAPKAAAPLLIYKAVWQVYALLYLPYISCLYKLRVNHTNSSTSDSFYIQ